MHKLKKTLSPPPPCHPASPKVEIFQNPQWKKFFLYFLFVLPFLWRSPLPPIFTFFARVLWPVSLRPGWTGGGWISCLVLAFCNWLGNKGGASTVKEIKPGRVRGAVLWRRRGVRLYLL